MRRKIAAFLLGAFGVAVIIVLLSPSGVLDARGRAPNSLQPDPTAVFFTMVLQRNQPVSRGNLMILPRPDGRVSQNSHGKGGGGGGGTGGGGGGTGSCCGALTLSTGSASYTAVGAVEQPTTTQPEAEEEIAADPTNPDNLVAAISDFSNASGYNNTKWALSTDSGSTWLESFVPIDSSTGLLTTSDNQEWQANSDPVVAFDRSGNVFLSDLYLKLDAYGRIIGEGLYVSSGKFSSIGASNFAGTYPVYSNPNDGKIFTIEDKPWIAVDNSGGSTDGYVYASWSHFTGCQNQYSPLYGGYVLTCSSDSIYLSYSTNHGVSWSAPVQISPGTQNGAVQGSQPAVGSDGKVYVTYEFFGSNNQRQQYLAVGTWSSGSLGFSSSGPFVVSPVFSELTFAGCSTCTASYRVNSFPNIAVGPPTNANASGNVYLVYGAQTSSTSTAQVNFVACTSSCTGSSSFYGPAILNDVAAGDHFFPAISVDSGGTINTSWFDSRYNPSNPDLLDVFAAFLTYDSTTNSLTVSPNTRVTPTTINVGFTASGFNFGDTSFIGDYIGIAATAATGTASATAHPVWTDVSGAFGIPLYGFLQTSSLTLPAGTP